MQIGIKKTLLLYSVAAAIIPIILIGLISRPIIREHLISEADESSVALAHSLANQITTYLREPEATFRFIASHISNKPHSKKDFSDTLADLADSYSYFESLYSLDGKGKVDSVGFKSDAPFKGEDYLGMDFSSIEICKTAQHDNSFKWQSSVSVTSGEPSISFCAPMGEGSLLATLKLSNIGQIISKGSDNRLYEVFIVDRKGKIISHPDPDVTRMQQNISNLKIIRDGLEGKTVSGSFDFRNRSYRGSVVNIEGFDWLLVVAQRLDVAMAPVKALEKIFILGILSTLLLVAFASLAASSILGKPFTLLAGNAHKVIDEDYDNINPISSRLHEINLLSETLLKMVSAVRSREELLNEQTEELMTSEENLRDLNQNLEEKVRERTERLAAAMEELNTLNLDLTQRGMALESANHQLESFAYSVSHDLRAPLRHVGSFATIIAEEYEGVLDAKGKDYLKRVIKGCNRMDELINAILDFSRVSRLQLNFTSVDMSGLAEEVLSDFQDEISAMNARISVEPLPVCNVDRVLMKQVLVNLLSNALKYSRNRETPTVTIGSSITGSEHLFFVRDNGAGFDMRYADKLFSVFSRLHRQEDFEGIGVGLAIVQNIIQRHDGRIWAEAKPDEGATFFFTLPG